LKVLFFLFGGVLPGSGRSPPRLNMHGRCPAGLAGVRPFFGKRLRRTGARTTKARTTTARAREVRPCGCGLRRPQLAGTSRPTGVCLHGVAGSGKTAASVPRVVLRSA
jgi:hypothetical protein